ncbi:Chorion class high-cysteine HCB protein 13, partial [Dysosmobacter welbionis]
RLRPKGIQQLLAQCHKRRPLLLGQAGGRGALYAEHAVHSAAEECLARLCQTDPLVF